MRIGLVCPYSLSVPGGVQGQVLGLARVLRAQGHAARVLAPCDGPPPDACVTPLGDSIPTAANGSVAPLAPDPACVLRTIRALRDEAFDVLHLHEPLAPGPTMTALLAGSSPMVGTFHAAGTSAAYRWLNPVVRRWARRLAVRCAVSVDAMRMAERSLGGQYELVFNGIERERYSKAAPVLSDAPAIVFIGRHEPRKGLEVLLEALRELPRDLRVWVAGDGPETGRLSARYAGDSRIEWLGRISDDEKARRLAGASLFCAPSISGESFGVVLLEAMAAGTPIVASDLPGYRNVARPGVDALLVEPGAVSQLAQAIRRVLDEPGLAAELTANADSRAHQFSMEALAERYLDIYERVAHARTR